MDSIASEIKKLSFEQAVKELEAIAHQLENNSVDLDESIKLFARGNDLRKHCDAKLQEAKLKVDKIVANGSKITGTQISPLAAEYGEA